MFVSRLYWGLVFLGFVTATVAYGQRLPDTVVPRHYTLRLTPDLKAATFTGVETIEVDVKQSVQAIVLNAAEIKFGTVTAEAGGKDLPGTVTLDDTKEQASLNFGQTLRPGSITLRIEYTGMLNNELRGFYLSKTRKRNYAVTQFEPTDARRAFPSFDEPALKATFSVTLVVDQGDTAISNTNVVSDTPGPSPDKHTVRFATTPKMSTYLVAFLVGDFQCISGQSDGTPIRVCGTPDKMQYAQFALAAAEFNLHYYNQYFGIKYPMPKLDLIGIPDFEAGAMENFGAITFRETALFVGDKTASLDAKKLVAVDVAHEMAHQWFGDMVTMDWWNDIWLNEGFATWMENKPVAAWKPQWKMAQDVAEGLNGTLNYDAQKVTRAIRAKADTPDEINQMFDGISYGKAAAVLLMTEQYEGPETFRRGVHNYLEAHTLGNASAADFWNAQASVSHKPVDKILSSYVTEAGEPGVRFSQPQDGRVQVTQQRFYLNPNVKPDGQETWTIPVCFAVTHAETQCDVLNSAEGTLHYPPSNVFFPDAGGRGYYRFALPNDVYATVLADVETELTPEERIALLGDLWAGVRANKDAVGDYLRLAEAVKADPNAAVVDTATSTLGAIDQRIAATPAEHEALAKWVVKTYKPAYEKLGPPSFADSPNTAALRSALFGVLGTLGKDPEVIAESKKIAEQHLSNPASVDPNLAQIAAAIAAENGDAAFFDRLQHTFETTGNPQIQEEALHYLALFSNPELQRRSLEFAVSGKVRNQDAVFQLLIPMNRPETRDVAWDFIRNHWDQVKAQFTVTMGAYLVEGTGVFCSDEKRQQVVDFFSTHKVAASDVSLQRAKESIDDCVELRSTQGPKLQQWVSQQ